MKKRVLVIDDEEDIAEVIGVALQSDYAVSILHAIRDPLAEVAEADPDIILLDLWIPELGGEEVLAKLKKNPETNHIPVVIISADNQAQEIAHSNKADAFLAKPFRIKELKDLIRTLLTESAES